jgi:hypothetical protein
VYALSETADAAAIQLFIDNGFVSEVAATATVLLGYVEAQQTGLADQLPGVAIDVVLSSPAGVVREHFGLDKSRDGIAECRQVIIHPIGAVWHRQISFRSFRELTTRR